MGCAYLGAGHADLGARVDVHAAVGLAGDGAAHGVGDAHGQGSPLLAVPKAHQSVCCFPWNTGKHREAQGAHTGMDAQCHCRWEMHKLPNQGLCSLKATEVAAATAH